MKTESTNNVSYFFIDKNDLFINDNEENYDNSISMYFKFWNVYSNIKTIIEAFKRNPYFPIENYKLKRTDLESRFIEEQIPKKYQKFIIAIPNKFNSDGYELITRSEIDLTSLEKIEIDGHIFAFGKSIEKHNLYACFELKSISEEEAINFRKELIDNDIFESYKYVANKIFNKKTLERKQVRA